MPNTKTGSQKTLFSAGGLILVLFILVFVNLIFSRVNLRWDVTADKLYSLSDSTQKILANLNENVTIKVFYSKNVSYLPVYIKNYARRMLDFLSEYEFYSNGTVTIEVYNPTIDSEEEDWAQKYGIKAVNLGGGDTIYFGLVAVAADQEENIAFLNPIREKHLEYDITRIITRVQSSRKKKVAIISGLPVFGRPPQAFNMSGALQVTKPWLFVTELKKTYAVSEIKSTAESIPRDIDLLIMVQPKNLSVNLQYAVDQFVLNGGNVILFSDPFAVMDTRPGQPGDTSLEKLLTAWGVQLNSAQILADFDNATRIMTRSKQVENSSLWISLPPEAFNTDNMITAELETMLLPVTGVIQKIPASQFEYEPLLQSSTNSSTVDSLAARFGGGEIRRSFKPTEQKYDLAALVQGRFKTAFPGGRPGSDETDHPNNIADSAAGKAPPHADRHLTAAQKETGIIIVADSDMLFDNYFEENQNFLGFNISRIFNDNLNFLLNCGEMLAGNPELIKIRSRGKFERPFTRVKNLEQKAQARWLTTEQELVRKVEATNRKLRELEQQKDTSQKYIISEQQEVEIHKFKQEKSKINKELKKVRRNLRSDIERCGMVVKFVNIFLMPLIVSISGIFYALYIRKKRSHLNKVSQLPPLKGVS